jgi:hypothetical protein
MIKTLTNITTDREKEEEEEVGSPWNQRQPRLRSRHRTSCAHKRNNDWYRYSGQHWRPTATALRGPEGRGTRG